MARLSKIAKAAADDASSLRAHRPTRLSKMAKAMTADEFSQTVTQFPRLSEKAIDIARAILVDGRSLKEVCDEFDVNRQLAYQWTSKVYMGHFPKGWVSEVVTLPELYMKRVRKLAAELGARARKEDEEARASRLRTARP